MRKAFLIGFQYKHDKKLPGIIIDLYKVYKFLIKNGWQEEEISILTDILEDESAEVLRKSLLENNVKSDILTFIEDCNEKNQYVLFKSYHHYNNFSSFLTNTSALNKFIYYTGHSKDGNIILPDNSLLELELFKNYCINNITKDISKIIFIMDCCEGGIRLPFVLKDNFFRCRKNVNLKDFSKEEIICICSSTEKQKSISTSLGSPFTRSLVNILEDSSLSLSSILEKIRFEGKEYKNQHPNIFSSFPHLYNLPGFLYSFPSFSLLICNNYLLLM